MKTPTPVDTYGEWGRKGATLSDTTAGKEFGLTYAELVRAIRAGKLQYREGSIYGNPYLRLLRREVEALVRSLHGDAHLKQEQVKAELAAVTRELRSLKKKAAALEARKSQLLADLGGASPRAPTLPARDRHRG